MNNRAQYYTQILEKIATPLMAAVLNRGEANDSEAQAQAMASLLAQSVKTSIALGEIIDIGAMGEQSDSMRVALAGLAAPLVAAHFERTGKAVEEGEIKALATAMQAALGFAENFTPNAENTARLENLETGEGAADLPQIHAHYMRILVPAIQAVQGFSFGHQANKLVADIASKLVAHAEEIAEKVTGKEDAHAHKRAALPILSGLVGLYTDCHKAEVTRIQALDEDARAALPKDGNGFDLKTLWDSYDLHVALMEVLVGSILGDTPPSTQPEQETQAPPTQAAVAEPSESEAPPPPPPAQETKAAANPMSMFAKKPTAEAPPPPADPPPAAAPPATPPPAAPDPVEKTKESDDATDAQAPTGGPMSFFKAKPKEEGEE